MKFLITENKITKVIQKYISFITNVPEFNWVDKIVIELGSVEGIGSDIFPLYTYKVYFKEDNPDYELQLKLWDDISSTHKLFFQSDSEGNPVAYFTTYSIKPDGSTDSLPSFKVKVNT
jgi:hypothetical protein